MANIIAGALTGPVANTTNSTLPSGCILYATDASKLYVAFSSTNFQVGGPSLAISAGGASVNSGTVTFSNAHGVSFGLAGSTLTASVAAASQFSAGISTLGNTAGTSGTVSNQLLLVGGNSITLSGSTAAGGATVSIIGPTIAAANTFSAGISTLGNTAGTSGTVSNQILFVGGNSITLSGSTAAGGATVSIIGPTIAASVFSAGMSTIGNTAGTSGLVTNRLIIAAINAAQVSQSTDTNGATLSINANHGTFGITSSGNTAGTSGTVPYGLILVGTNGITLSQSTDANKATVTISGITAPTYPAIMARIYMGY